ncbi:amidohydrolase family protein [Paenibacillus sp. J5C_2022]|uniref:amidohydrolase family protein n=1 Tax=Paenibacillus sp. J5C2022 TaxID=2977129 RepID=UPI0021CEBC33|nr:amidohydrolase family protein [Paenibacillus sp. J5C2022]MCU6707767.1 amidohydrolase family protein [Paenibacillus sp. J5C2022]
MRIDAHQHYWTIKRNDYGWITPELPVLYRDFLPEHLRPHLRNHGLDGSILVQAAPTIEETDFILQLADGNDTVLGVVGWLNLFDPNHRLHYERFRRHPKFVGFRIMIQDMPDASRLLEPSFVQALRLYESEDVPVDLLVVSRQLPHAVKLLEQVPHLRAVIDHIAKPRVKDAEREPWLSHMTALSRMPNVYCKLSGMVTEADHSRWRREDFMPYIRQVLELFGPERVMFGSDWPVCLLAADYDEVMDVLASGLPDNWGEEERARLFGLNAQQFYKLKQGRCGDDRGR